MASTTAPGEFRLVYLVDNAITCLLTQDQQVACFAMPPGTFGPAAETTRPFHVGEHHLGFDTFDLVHQRLVSHH